MTRTTSRRLLQHIAVFSLIASFSPLSSQAGILSGHPDAFGGWTGTVPFSNAAGLNGTIDYAVFTAAKFNTNFGGMGYTPGDSLVYTYQVNVGDASLFASAEIVGVINPANTIGTFGPLNASDIDATAYGFDFVGNAEWFFTPDEIPAGLSSYGLAFSSPNTPMAGASVTVDGGTFANALGLPTPSEFAVPEPMSVSLVATAFVAIFGLRRRGN